MLEVKAVYAESMSEFEDNMHTAIAGLKGKRIISIFYTTDAVVQVKKTVHPSGSTVEYDSQILKYYNGFIEYERE